VARLRDYYILQNFWGKAKVKTTARPPRPSIPRFAWNGPPIDFLIEFTKTINIVKIKDPEIRLRVFFDSNYVLRLTNRKKISPATTIAAIIPPMTGQLISLTGVTGVSGVFGGTGAATVKLPFSLSMTT